MEKKDERLSVKAENAQSASLKRTSFRKITSNGTNVKQMTVTGTIEELNIMTIRL